MSLPLKQIPISLFEVGDVVLKDSTTETNTRNERRLCALYTNHTSELEVIHGLLDYLMRKLKVPKAGAENHGSSKFYTLVPSNGKITFILYQILTMESIYSCRANLLP